MAGERDKILQVYRGNLDNLPNLESNVINVFLSSTFTDYATERNLIMRDAVPKLRQYCHECCLDFQVADMRWGVRDDAQNDHQTTELVLQQIANSKEISRGPYFVAFLGEKYGFRPFPNRIEANEYRILYAAAKDANDRNTSLLDDWFLLDENTVPPTYVMQPITSKFPFYSDDSEENKEQHEKDQEDWNAVDTLLTNIFRQAADFACKNSEFTKQQKHKYFQSVTENEVFHGILSADRDEANLRTLCFTRTLTDFNYKDTLARRFKDLEGGEEDLEAKQLSEDLKNKKIPGSLGPENIHHYTVPWASNGITEDNSQQAEYLSNFSAKFKSEIITLLNKNLERKSEYDGQKELFKEILHHSHFCVSKVKVFEGQDDLLKKVKTSVGIQWDIEDVSDEKESLDKENGEKTNITEDKMDKESKEQDDKTKTTEDVMDSKSKEQDDKTKTTEDVMDSKSKEQDDKTKTTEDVMDSKSKEQDDKTKTTEDVMDSKSKEQDDKTKTTEDVMDSKSKEQDDETKTTEDMMDSKSKEQDDKTKTTEDTMDSKSKEQDDKTKTTENMMDSNSKEKDEEREERETLSKKAFDMNFAMEEEDINLEDIRLELIKRNTLKRYGKPLLLYGSPGSGKTALMAKIAMLSDDWFQVKPVKMIRFLGTSPKSSSIKDTLVGLCEQIWAAYGVESPEEVNIGSDFMFLVLYFHALLQRIDTEKQPLVIILDAVDQLKEEDNAYSLKWIPTLLPPQVYIIVSILGTGGKCFDSLQHIPDKTRVIEVQALPPEKAMKVFDKWSESEGRKVTEVQRNCILEKYKGCANALYLKLLYRQAKMWKSYSPANKLMLGSTVQAAIEHWFEDLQIIHGEILLSHSLAYLTASKQGLSDGEMEDILSLDDEVLQDTYLYHLPADPNSVRLAPLLWRRIRNDLKDYLLERQANGRSVTVWYHYQFKEFMNKSLLEGKMRKNVYSILADYFLGTYYGKVKPLELYKKKKGSFPNAKRQVPDMPNRYGIQNYNLRKMEELPLHLSYSHRFDDFVTNICRSFDFLYTKCCSIGIDQLLKDLKQAHCMVEDQDIAKEIQLLQGVLLLRKDIIQKDPHSFPSQLLGQLGLNTSLPEGLTELRSQVIQFCGLSKMPMLVPMSQCLPYPGTELRIVLNINIGFPGDAFGLERKISLSHDGASVWVVNRLQKNGDVVLRYHLEDARLAQVQHLRNMDVKRIRLFDQDRLLSLEVYTARDLYSPKFDTKVVDQKMESQAILSQGDQPLALSHDGRFCCTTVPRTYQVPDDMKKPKALLIDLEKNEVHPILMEDRCQTPYHGEFSEDGMFLALVSPNDVYCLELSSRGLIHRWPDMDEEEEEGGGGFGMFGDRTSNISETFVITKKNWLLTKGLTYNDNSKLLVYDLQSGKTIHKLEGHDYSIGFITLSADQTIVATATSDSVTVSGRKDKYARVWDLEKGKEISQCGEGQRSRSGSIYSLLTLCQDDSGRHYLITNCTDGDPILHIWYFGSLEEPLERGVLVHELINHNSTIRFAEVGLNNKVLVSAAQDNTVALWDLQKVYEKCHHKIEDLGLDEMRKQREQIPKSPNQFGEGMMVTTCMVVNKDCTKVVVGTYDGWLMQYDLATMEIAKFKKVSDKALTNLLVSKSGYYVISCQGKILVWNEAGEQMHDLKGPTGSMGPGAGGGTVSCMLESSDILIAGFGGMQCYGVLWNLATGENIKTLEGLYGFSQVACSSDVSKVITTFFDMPVIFDVSTGQPINFNQNSMDTMMGSCTCLVVSPDDRLVASGSIDGSVRVTDLQTAKYKFRMQHRSSVKVATFSKCSQFLLTAGFKNILLWSSTDGALLRTLTSHQNFVNRMVFSENGNYLVTCSEDKRLLVWDFKSYSTIASFNAHCAIKDIVVTHALSAIIFTPENVAYVGILKPNNTLTSIIKGERLEVPQKVQEAQALALAFSGQKIIGKTSKSCVIL